jgi:DHA2 family multidrug resistance protein-like MFS transporter
VAGATLAPSTLSLLRNMFGDPRQRTVAIAVWISSFSAGAAIGPLLGGVLLERFWWGSVFLLAVPVMLLLLVLGPMLLPEYRDEAAGRLDLGSAALSLAAVLAVIYGLKRLAQDGPGWPPALSILAGLGVGMVFVRRQFALPDPLVDLSLFGNRAFSAALAANTLDFFVSFAALLFIAQYLQLVVGLSPLRAGLWMLPSSVGFIVGSLLTPLLVRRARPAYVMAAGMALAAVGFALLTRLDPAGGLAVLVAGSVVFSLGSAPMTTLATDLMVGTAPTGAGGGGLGDLGDQLGARRGAGHRDPRQHRQCRLPWPDGRRHSGRGPTPGGGAARDTLGGALAVAEQLSDQLGGPLVEAARQAFTSGLQLAFAISAAIAVGIAILVAVLLRGVDAGSEPEEPPAPCPDGPCAGKVGVVKLPDHAVDPRPGPAPLPR